MTELRNAETSDVETIQKLNKQLSDKEAEEFDQTINVEYTLTDEAAEWYRQRINEDDGFAMVAEDSGEVVGYAVGGIQKAEEFRDINTIAEIESMYLEPEYRGQGIGTQFVEKLRDWAVENNADRLRAEASAGNKAGIDFYRQQGLKDYSVTLEENLL
jgi:GNAT superfamily N-acetyltransferase